MSNLNISDNVVDKLNLILLNIPENLSVIEKIRWVYVKTGELFSYDFRVLTNLEYAKTKVDFQSNYISKFQTCVQISKILNIMLNYIEGCKSKVIPRVTDVRGIQALEHVANEVTLETGEVFILDLTLDLYLIQSGCQTKQFGYDSSPIINYDIISLPECRAMDEKMGLIKNGEYTDKKIEKINEELSHKIYKNDSEKISDVLKHISEVIPKFLGYHEGKQFVNKLLIDLLPYSYKEFNLTKVSNGEMNLLTCFKVMSESEDIWFLYYPDCGIIKTDFEVVKKMLDMGWETKSKSFLEEIGKIKKI